MDNDDPSPPMHAVKRLFLGALTLLLLGAIVVGIGGYSVLTAANPQIPHPWGQIRMMHFSTNNLAAHAHYRFKNLFAWPVFIEVAMEIRTDRGWELARGYSMFVPIEKEVKASGGDGDFSVPIPFDCKSWRVLVRAYQCQPSDMEMRRAKIKDWLASHGVHSVADRIKVIDPNGYVLPGPEMKFEKPGQLPVAQYEGYIGQVQPIPSPKGTIRTVKCR